MLTAAQLGGAELPEAPLEPGTAIRQRFAARLERLSPQSKTALLVTAAAGRCALAEVNEAVARLGNGDGKAFFDEAETAGLVRLVNDRIEFSHPLVRSLAYHAAVPAQRRAVHRALAETLAGRDAERAAWHLAAAATGSDDAAAAALDAAATAAAGKGAPLEAAAAWERAADCTFTDTKGPVLRVCTVDYALGNGLIVTSGYANGPGKAAPVTLVIDGGTGAYADAHGYGLLQPDATGSHVTLHLSH